MENAVDAADLERIVVAKEMKRGCHAEAQAGGVMADRWREEEAVDAADLERSGVAKQMKVASHAEEQAGWVMADRWKEEEIDLLLKFERFLGLKELAVLKLQKKMKVDILERKESELDRDDMRVFKFCKRWMEQWSDLCYSWECVTSVSPMPFSYHSAPKCVSPCYTLQIYSAKVEGLSEGLEWPLDVFGMLAVRDSVDRKRNIVFCRSRDDCQTITEKDPYLTLTGPSRAVCLDWKTDPMTDVVVEADLKVRGKESEDRHLSFLAAPVCQWDQYWTPSCAAYRSKCSLLVFTLGYIETSVEAAIFVRVIEGSWPDGINGQITALDCLGDEKVVLLEFGADSVPVSAAGDVELSRRIVSVDLCRRLVVSCDAWEDDKMVAEQCIVFKAALAGRSFATLPLGTCKLEVIVVWSLVSPEPGLTELWC